MYTKRFWLSWLYLYTLCAVLGFIPQPYGLIKALLVLAAVGFFIPGGLLIAKGTSRDLKRVIFLSILSLVLTMALVILNFTSVLMTEIWGKIFYILLGIVSAPMFCGQFWILSLFGWACLLAAGVFRLVEKRK
jgi:hypothetical protein